ncbi:MAG: alpha/beta hydrolase [Actinomycetota bacterium]|nr:alpha/beta hydrolase [Actinomycetota bacterium]
MPRAEAGHDTAPLEFAVRGQRIAGILRTPRPQGAARGPGIVLTGPFTGVKEQVVAVCARRLADAGIAALAFDHRNFGASDGEPRQHEDAAGKLEDLRCATSALAAQPAVDATAGRRPCPAASPGPIRDRALDRGRLGEPGHPPVRELLTFDAAMGAEFLAGTPALFIHGRRDDFCSPEGAYATYERL